MDILRANILRIKTFLTKKSTLVALMLVISIATCFIAYGSPYRQLRRIFYASPIDEPGAIALHDCIVGGKPDNLRGRVFLNDDQDKTAIKLLDSLKPYDALHPYIYDDAEGTYKRIWAGKGTRNEYERLKFFIATNTRDAGFAFCFFSPDEVIFTFFETAHPARAPYDQNLRYTCSEKLYNEIMIILMSSAMYEYYNISRLHYYAGAEQPPPRNELY